MTERNCESCIFIKSKSGFRQAIEIVFDEGITNETIGLPEAKTADCWTGHIITPEVYVGEEECSDYFQNFSTRINDMLDNILKRG